MLKKARKMSSFSKPSPLLKDLLSLYSLLPTGPSKPAKAKEADQALGVKRSNSTTI
ncbi:hypothetical protein FRC00_009510, partial [Tulasnella sp. 408]